MFVDPHNYADKIFRFLGNGIRQMSSDFLSSALHSHELDANIASEKKIPSEKIDTD
jgi:hypothetical protein